ncbi:hemerythrin domain-containing protein [Streptomyces spectabilis]|uniref:Hemerythrin domain-containing protein n=1 Tax=Streptomyces spectabilis TaxID=68270 RepID=A0A516RIK0_STRST|nr:hemerythrin domain-containing protein [Streptomyces spectabilis]QDQ15455.1 hemerythrin domain-containing protein [Streptomyces spectabilis]
MRDRLDMTVTYAMHHALRRELRLLAQATTRAGPDPRDVLRTAGWQLFRTALHAHHSAEDDALWPSLRQALRSHPLSLTRLEAIEAEHAALARLLETIDQALADPDAGLDLCGELTGSLVTGLRGHLHHEEEAVFPLVQSVLSEEQWEQFGRVHAQRVEADAAQILPWILDGAAERTVAAVLAQLLPESAHRTYADRWRPAYAALDRWDTWADLTVARF